ncbi:MULTISPECIES: cytochrome P450 [unclassified Streptomyces]|uniref:cytochrome P450 n=1 Tax=unclassified Streptomyces TaxID=2593676 RepID=UPI001E4FFF12|nr:cytochrome P450 [Streptomyces sp. CB02980]MCB8908419.1 cytochrome P450 [Streptomyces sp. CB02980]
MTETPTTEAPMTTTEAPKTGTPTTGAPETGTQKTEAPRAGTATPVPPHQTKPMVDPAELESLDLADPVLHAERDLTEVWRHLRAERPMYWQEARGSQPGFWVVSRHQDAMAVYRDKEHFTTERGNALGTLLTGGDSAAGTMLAVTDGVRHSQIRNILMKAFSPRMLHDIREGLRETVDGLLVDAIEKGECDFAEDVSGSVPLGAICDLLGVPRSDRKYLLGLTSRAWSSDHADAPPEDSWTAKSEILLYFADLAATRKHSEHDDVVSLLANSQIEGERLSDAELMANCYGLMIGGDETGRHAITGGLLALKQYPDQWKALRTGEAKLDTAVEEILRWTVPSIHGGRAATGDVVVNGQLIKAGDVVSVWISSGNFDGDVFADPYRFDLNRTPNKHLTFAHGAHFCLGHYLARMEIEAVLDGLRRMVTDIEQTGPESWIYSTILHGMHSLPVSLKPDPSGMPKR